MTEQRLRLPVGPSLSSATQSSGMPGRRRRGKRRRRGRDGEGWEEGGKERRKTLYKVYLNMIGAKMRNETKEGKLMGPRERKTQANREVKGCFGVTPGHQVHEATRPD